MAPSSTNGGTHAQAKAKGQAQTLAVGVPPLDPRQSRLARQAGIVAVGLLVCAGLYFGVMAGVVRYVDNIRDHPWRFVLELVLISVGVVVPYVIVYLMRGGRVKRLPLDVVLLTVKFAAGWLLFEISGVNHSIFPID